MNLAFIITPKKEVEYLFSDFSIRQALEKMEFHKYATIPVIDRATGKYLYSLSEGDVLWYLKENKIAWNLTEKAYLSAIKPSRTFGAVSIDTDSDSLGSLITNQNYVPVTDDNGVFIGIVTRKAILRDLLKK